LSPPPQHPWPLLVFAEGCLAPLLCIRSTMAIGAEAKKVVGGMFLRPAPGDDVGELKGKLNSADSAAVACINQHLALDSGRYAGAVLGHEHYSRRELPDAESGKDEWAGPAGPPPDKPAPISAWHSSVRPCTDSSRQGASHSKLWTVTPEEQRRQARVGDLWHCSRSRQLFTWYLAPASATRVPG